MRSSSTFLIFGGILLAVLLFAAISSYATKTNPAVRVAADFFSALHKNDTAKLQSLTDTDAVKLTLAGNKVVSAIFKGGALYPGAFSRREKTMWSYSEMTHMALNLKVDPVVGEDIGMAAVPLTNGAKIYLHRIEGKWKVFYISRSEDEQKQ